MDEWLHRELGIERQASAFTEEYYRVLNDTILDAFMLGLLLDRAHITLQHFPSFEQRTRICLNSRPYADIFIVGNAPYIRIVREDSGLFPRRLWRR
jgi:hypothetical protein